MRNLSLRVTGTAPLLLYRVDKHQSRKEITSSPIGNLTIEQEVLENMSKDGLGRPAVPISWLWGAIRDGCSRVVVGGMQLSSVILRGLLYLPEESVLLCGADGCPLVMEVYTSVQHASPGSKKMITVVAPMFRNWAFEMRISVDGDHTDDLLLQRIFNEAGKSGIGLFHPPKKQFGQFTAFITPADARLGQVTLSAVLPGLERVG